MKHLIWSSGHQLLLKNIVRADNCYLYDSEGKKYIDLESGVWCTSVGHCNPKINKAIISQIEKISHTGFFYANPVIENTSKKVLEITGLNDGKCEFLCSGSEAVEYGMRIARLIAEKPLALTFSDSYFGAYGEAGKRQHDNWINYNRLECSCNSKEGCTGECAEFNTIPFERIGIFLFEPGSSSGLVRFPSVKLIEKIAEKIKENHGIIIVNEVTTGIGRTGTWFGFQHYRIQPDIVAIGKGIGNGYPVSVMAVSKNVAEVLATKNFLYAQSHQNDPLGAVVAFEVINTIQNENLLLQCQQLGNLIIEQLNEYKKIFPIIRQVRGRGLMIAIELTEKAEPVQKELLKKGFILVKRSGGEVLRIDPSLTIKEKDIKAFLKTFGSILLKIQKK
ncbi:MAG: aspartate aminotransferase family protein [Prolixibacteraceae bacterium]|nr:aspartate aminotransferase family protein [Prolixibacteraceae bacterium]